MSQLVSSGDSVKVWDTGTYSCSYEWSGGPAASCHYSCCSWSCDLGCVATRARAGVVLTYAKKGGSYSSQEIQLQGVAAPSAVHFPRTSQKSLIVSSEASVHMYDLSRQKLSKSFSLRSRVSALTVNYCDAYIAAGCEDGALQLLTLASNQVSAPLTVQKCVGHKISSVKYNVVKPSLLGAACESGMLSFWDCNTNKNLFTLSPHMAPATAITFSPINDTLALSVGLDKRLVCCDTKARKQIMMIQCEAPLTSADFDQDGVNLAVGSSRGKILVYDLRKPKAPLHNIAAHNSTVTSVLFKPKPSGPSLSGSAGAGATKSRSRLNTQKSTPSLKTVQEEGKENTDPTSGVSAKEEVFSQADEKMLTLDKLKDESVYPGGNRRESLSSMLFSPLRESDTSFTSHASGSVSRDNTDSRLGLERRQNESLRRFSSDSVFSPLRDSPASTNLSLGKRTPFTSFSTPPTMSPLTIIREELAQDPSSRSDSRRININNEPENADPIPSKERLSLESLGSFVKETINTGSKSPDFQTVTGPRTRSPPPQLNPSRQRTRSSESTRTLSEGSQRSRSPAERPRSSELLSVLTAFPHLAQAGPAPAAGLHHDLSSAVTRIADKLSSSASPLHHNNNKPGPDTAETFHREYISSVVGEAMQEWCEGVDQRLWSFHYGLLRQLQAHQEETRGILVEMTGLAEMRQQLETLKKENSELKKFFGANPS